MTASTTPSFTALKSLLLELNPTGNHGFEGLIAVSLGAITGVPFRLAASGTQRGIDGETAFPEGGIAFEGKLYAGKVPRQEVITKIADLARSDKFADIVWVLGSTSPVSTQLADDLRSDADRSGISVLVLDWSETDMPLLAVAMAMAEDAAAEFCKSHLSTSTNLSAGLKELAEVQHHPHYDCMAEQIRRALDAPSMGVAMARRKSEERFLYLLADRERARDTLGQALAPGDVSAIVRPRSDLIARVQPFFAGAPDGAALAIVGGEGNGKSWLAMQSWLTLPNKPFLVFFAPDDFADVAARNDVESLLIAQMLFQSSDPASPSAEMRWRRRFASWRQSDTPEMPRFVVCVDGVNQRPGHEWGRILSKVAAVMQELGGRLMFTSRQHYFDLRIRGIFTRPCHQVRVGEWSGAERDGILGEYGVAIDKLSPSVAETLKNPRLLAIALEVFGPTEVTAFEELSVSRLLFEHIRAGARYEYGGEPVDVFVGHLRQYAGELLQRVAEKRIADIKIFEADTRSVAEGRFFKAVPGESRKYELVEDGLSLALGFALAERLRAAIRAGEDWETALDLILEPISALDGAANVILATLTVIAVEESEYTPDLAKGLIKAFAALQNPDEDHFPSFVGIAKKLPVDLFTAAAELHLAEFHLSNIDWVEAALKQAAEIDLIWNELQFSVRSALSSFSLDPKRGTFKHPRTDPQGEVDAEEKERREKIASRLKALSPPELALHRELKECEGDYTKLTQFLFRLLAGKRLAPFARELVLWAFGQSLNPAIHGADKEFFHLISLNSLDWAEAQAALHQAIGPLQGDVASRTGRWTVAKVLQATGASDDARAARILIDELTKDHTRYPRMRLVEEYCEADPCDPDAVKPDNIDVTALDYAKIDVTKVREGMYLTSPDHLFQDARLGLARFAPKIAIKKTREFADQVLTRDALPLRQGLLELRVHNALLDKDFALRLINRAMAIAATRSDDKDLWLSQQYCLLLALPFFDFGDQIAHLFSATDGKKMLLDMMDVIHEPERAALESALHDALAAQNTDCQYFLIELAREKGIAFSEPWRNYISTLPVSPERSLRAASLGYIAGSDDDNLLSVVADGTWTAENVPDKHWYELWYGSLALLRAASRGLISQTDAISRVSPRLYGQAVAVLGKPVAAEIGRLVDVSMGKVLNLDIDLAAPEIEMCHVEGLKDGPIRVRLDERDVPGRSLKEGFSKFEETNKEFEDKQRRTQRAYTDFRDALSRASAMLILDSLRLEDFKTIVDANPGLALRWRTMFLNAPTARLPAAYNLVLLLAHAIGDSDPSGAEALYRRVADCEPLVRFTFGKAAIKLDAVASWAGAAVPALDRLRVARLDTAKNDHELAMEVIAASEAGRKDLILNYISERTASGEPSRIARGIMVAGFADINETSELVFERFKDAEGLPGFAREAAVFAYQRNRWSRHWFEVMAATDSPETLWSAAMLFLKIVDGRFSNWRSDFAFSGSALRPFNSSLGSRLSNRYKAWEKHRKGKLFGREAPEVHFLR